MSPQDVNMKDNVIALLKQVQYSLEDARLDSTYIQGIEGIVSFELTDNLITQVQHAIKKIDNNEETIYIDTRKRK